MKSYFLLFLFIVTFVHTQECLEDYFFNLVNTNGTFDSISWNDYPQFFNDPRLITFRKDNIERLISQWFCNDKDVYDSFLNLYLTTYVKKGFSADKGTAYTIKEYAIVNNIMLCYFEHNLNLENMTIIETDNISRFSHKRYLEREKFKLQA